MTEDLDTWKYRTKHFRPCARVLILKTINLLVIKTSNIILIIVQIRVIKAIKETLLW
jgi:hypothetical protein